MAYMSQPDPEPPRKKRESRPKTGCCSGAGRQSSIYVGVRSAGDSWQAVARMKDISGITTFDILGTFNEPRDAERLYLDTTREKSRHQLRKALRRVRKRGREEDYLAYCAKYELDP